MNRCKTVIGYAIALLGSCVLADEWGTWNDLPNNLLESDDGVHSLDELSSQLDLLIQNNRDIDDGMRRQLLRHWLDRINVDSLDTVSLDYLLEMSEDWDDGDGSEWRDDLEDFMEEQAERQDDMEDELDDDLDDPDDDGSDDDDAEYEDDDDSE